MSKKNFVESLERRVCIDRDAYEENGFDYDGSCFTEAVSVMLESEGVQLEKSCITTDDGAYPYLEDLILNFAEFNHLRKVTSDLAETLLKCCNDADSVMEDIEMGHETDSCREGSNLFLDKYDLAPFIRVSDVGKEVRLEAGFMYEEEDAFKGGSSFFEKDLYMQGKLKLVKSNSHYRTLDGDMSKEDIAVLIKAVMSIVQSFSKKYEGFLIEEVVIFPFASDNSCGIGPCCNGLCLDLDERQFDDNEIHCRVVVTIQ